MRGGAALLGGALVASLGRPRAAAGQTATWAGAGVGIGSAGILAQLDLSRQGAPRLVRGRLTAHSNLGGSGTRPDEGLVEVGALVGRGAVCCGGNWGMASVGAAVVSGQLGPEATGFTTLGIAAEASLISWRRPHLVLSALGNLNPERPFAALSLAVLLGRMPSAAARAPGR